MQVIEVENEILETIVRKTIADNDNNKATFSDKWLLDAKYIQVDQYNFVIASSEAFEKIWLKDVTKKEKEWCEHQGKLRLLKINNN